MVKFFNFIYSVSFLPTQMVYYDFNLAKKKKTNRIIVGHIVWFGQYWFGTVLTAVGKRGGRDCYNLIPHVTHVLASPLNFLIEKS